MSKLTLLLAVPTLLGVGALAVWNVSLQSELEALQEQASVEPEQATTAANSGSTMRSTALSERASTRLRQLEARLETMEARATAPQRAGASGAGTASALPGALAAKAGDDELVEDVAAAVADGPDAAFKAKVYAALDEREERRRQERRERESQRQAERMLRGIEVSDQQAAQVAATLLDYFVQRDGLRREDDLEPEAKRARFKELSDARNTTIEGIVGAEAYAQVQKRVERRANDNRRKTRNNRGGQRKQPQNTD